KFLTRFPNSSAHDPNTLLGMELTYNSEAVTLSQKKLTEKGLELLKEATDHERAEFERLKINYCTHTGILNYLECHTRPDLTPAVSILSSFNSPWHDSLEAGDSFLEISSRHSDDLETFLSRSGSICFWKSCPISWNSKKQRNITLSSTEAELNALSDGVQENLWIRFLIEELYNNTINPTEFNVENKGLLDKINNFGSNSKTKHLDIMASRFEE
ncbi:hypothetical protein VP01_7267g1, partial [Puccinia sorghi]